jgi:bicarbonate transport system permease protein
MANVNRRSGISKPTKSGFKLSNKQRALLDDILTPVVTILILLVIWEILSAIGGNKLPGPIKVVREAWDFIFYPFFDRGGTDVGLGRQVFAAGGDRL